MFATEEGKTEMVKFLLEQKGIDINAKTFGFFYLNFILKI